jgi:hypothetical protein
MRKVFGAVSVTLALVGCGGETPDSKLPPYERHAVELFDDEIEPRAVGLAQNIASTPRSDPMVRERTQTGDAVLRVRIETVTQSGLGVGLTLLTLEKLAGERPPPPSFPVNLGQKSPSMGIVRGLEDKLGGKTFIAFVKAFNVGGERQYHFHLAPDTKDVRDAVSEAVGMGDFK